jgi:signal peptidase I
MIVVAVAGAALGAYGIFTMLGYTSRPVASMAMSPTFEPGNQLVVHRYGGEELHRGDVITFDRSAFGESGISVFRVAGVGGDRVACCQNGKLTVNGKQITEPYLSTGKDSNSLTAHSTFDTTVHEGTVFVVGDNRGNAADSRFTTAVPLSKVTGVVVATGTVLNPRALSPTTAFTDAGLPGAGAPDHSYQNVRWFLAGGTLLFLIGVIGVIVSAVRSAGRRRRAAAALPVH